MFGRDGEKDKGTETDANLNHELYYHFMGSDECEDILCWRDPDNPTYICSALITEDGKVIKLINLCNSIGIKLLLNYISAAIIVCHLLTKMLLRFFI